MFCHYLWSFDLNLVKEAAKKSYKPKCFDITFNSRRHDMMSLERYVGQSIVSFIRNVVYA